jgi:hypothetical protein
MCVFKNHAFIYFLRPPSWSGTNKNKQNLSSYSERVLKWTSISQLTQPLDAPGSGYAGNHDSNREPVVAAQRLSIHLVGCIQQTTQRLEPKLQSTTFSCWMCRQRHFITSFPGFYLSWGEGRWKKNSGSCSLLKSSWLRIYCILSRCIA